MQKYGIHVVLSLISLFFSVHLAALVTIPQSHPFSYDLGVKVIPSKIQINEITICCHGYGHSNKIVDIAHSYNTLPGHLIGFNFPDYNIRPEMDHAKSVYGTVDEILPLLYLLNYYACEVKTSTINLYGFSAGGGAIVNALAMLNHHLHDERLQQLGISRDHKKQILNVLERGIIILDCPLKSMEEVLAIKAKIPALEIILPNLHIMADRFAQNNMRPIDNLQLLAGLPVTILLHFQNPDEMTSNRDDALYIERLQKACDGKSHVVISSDGGHIGYHKGLWDYYKKLIAH